MNVELTIQHLYEQAPTIFKDRIDALNHLFCVIGNDFAWKDGELVENDFDFTEEYIKNLSEKLINGKAHQHNLLSLRAEAEIYYDEYYKKNNETCFETLGIKKTKEEYLANFSDTKYHMEEDRKKRWYFYREYDDIVIIDYEKEYAFLWNYPKDIKLDWLEAIEEVKDSLREDGFDI